MKNTIFQTEKQISFLKKSFESHLSYELNLTRVSAPLFVSKNSGIQDNLNGIEKPVSFKVKQIDDREYEIVQSLAKWKRYALYRYGVQEGEGIYTDMNAVRPDEESIGTGIHSVYVDQWDWEKTINESSRNLEFLKDTVEKIYFAIRRTEKDIYDSFKLKPELPEKITFITTEELINRFPDLSPKERENKICEKYGAVFLIGIGDKLSNGEIHDGRAPDYDDWNLNGDIIFWNPYINRAFEISSMGIRVDKMKLIEQCEIRDSTERLELPWHKMLLEGKLPQSIGGGIGQSRLSMFYLKKRHIGQVQVGAWSQDVIEECDNEGIELL